MQSTNLISTLELRVLSFQIYRIRSTTHIEFHITVKNQSPLLRVIQGACGAALALCQGELNPFIGAGNTAVLIKNQSTRLHMDLSTSDLLSGHKRPICRLLALGLFCVVSGCNRRSHPWPHDRYFYLSGCFGQPGLLVILELAALDAVYALPIWAVQFDPHIVQKRIALLELNHF